MAKELLSGNEAIARGAYEAGVTFASAYPGTPSTEILENIIRYKDDIYSQWGTNEKTAMEEALGASFTGARAIVTMKHVGLNVAADPLFSASYIGATGALVRMEGKDSGGNGTLIYFSCVDCNVEAAKVAANGGQVFREKFPIGQYGFIALVFDTEGNMIGLHSMQ